MVVLAPPEAADRIAIRPIRPEDGAAWLAFLGALSPATRFKRAARRLEDMTPEGVRAATNPDPAREIALVATPGSGAELCGVARLLLSDDGRTGEFLLVVADRWQRRGIGGRLLDALVAEAARRGVATVEGAVLATNRGMQEFVRRRGFTVEPPAPQAISVRVFKGLRG